MSTILYGRLTRRAQTMRDARARGVVASDDEKAVALAQQIAAVVPAEVLAIHGIVLASATALADDGSTDVTDPELLKWTLPVLLILALVIFVIAKRDAWQKADGFRALVPPAAFFAWTLLTGTSAATPWFADVGRGWLFLIGGVFGVLALALSTRLTSAD
jgi:hypothetical protein